MTIHVKKLRREKIKVHDFGLENYIRTARKISLAQNVNIIQARSWSINKNNVIGIFLSIVKQQRQPFLKDCCRKYPCHY
tara:strand:- start:20120 stop:20356 length:237 start_codon:yes stop_codon:yes gene_type:complete